MALTAKSYFAIREDGKKIILDDKTMTWELEQSEPVDVSSISVPSEPDLYSYVLIENAEEMCEFYIENYEGIDVINTINVLYLYMEDTYDTELEKSLAMKGIQYTYNYDIFNLNSSYRNGAIRYETPLSSLYFFWEYAQLLEKDKNYEEAAYWYQELARLYAEKKGGYAYSRLSNSLEEIQAKALLMNLKSIN